jgi:hypothetical protein
MFCTKCGAQNSDGAAFCVNCGNNLQASGAQGQQPQMQYTQPQSYAPQPNAYTARQSAYPGYSQQKNKKGLMIGLISGGVVLLAGIIVLIVVLTGGNASGNGILGTWYEQSGFAGTLNFKAGGDVDMEVMGQTITGEYTFDQKAGSGELTVLGQTGEFYLEDGLLNMEGAMYTRDHVDQQDLSDLGLPNLELPDLDLSDFD